MSANASGLAAERGFALGALALAWVLYGCYLFLPVAGPAPWGTPDSSMPGLTTLLACFLFPQLWVLWPVAAGHLLFWGGSVLLAFRGWRGAAIAGFLALAVSIVITVLLWPAVYVGMYCKLLGMGVLGAAGVIGRRFSRDAASTRIPP